MRVEVLVDGVWCGSVSELRAAVGADNVVFDFDDMDHSEEGCLCQIDIRATAERCGRLAVEDKDYYGMAWEFKPKTQAKLFKS